MKEGEDSKKGCRKIIQLGMGATELCGNIYYGSPILCDYCKGKIDNYKNKIKEK